MADNTRNDPKNPSVLRYDEESKCLISKTSLNMPEIRSNRFTYFLLSRRKREEDLPVKVLSRDTGIPEEVINVLAKYGYIPCKKSSRKTIVNVGDFVDAVNALSIANCPCFCDCEVVKKSELIKGIEEYAYMLA